MKGWVYKPKTDAELRKWVSGKKSQEKKKNGEVTSPFFLNPEDFVKWHNAQKKECYYCGLSEEDCQTIVCAEIGGITSNRFPEKGNRKRGRGRGYWLEVDKKAPKGDYNEDNSVLACYFCNNDKSDVFTAKQYKQFRENRQPFLTSLINGQIRQL